jgi:3'-phosphoadenosine 5'-phosphosulfate (PAPS) 3'-phosphatase
MTEAGAYLALLEEIADQTDQIALRLFRATTLSVDVKADRSPVSEADRAIESLAREVVGRRYPGLGILGEEEGEVVAGGQTRLIIDPIDATANFVRGIPIFATLLAIEDHGEVVPASAGFWFRRSMRCPRPSCSTAAWEAGRSRRRHRLGCRRCSTALDAAAGSVTSTSTCWWPRGPERWRSTRECTCGTWRPSK